MRGRTPTQQDTADQLFGASADTYSWWCGMSGSWDFTNDAPDGWVMTVKIDNPDAGSPKVLERIVTHSMLIGALRQVADGRVNASRPCVENAIAFLKDPEDADFDAGAADEVLQVAVLGQVVYG